MTSTMPEKTVTILQILPKADSQKMQGPLGLVLDPVTPREVLEQALSHLVDQVVPDKDGDFIVPGWTMGEWFDTRHLPATAGLSVQQVCSFGALLLGRRLSKEKAKGVVDFMGLENLYDADPAFRRAVQLLHNQIKAKYPGWHMEVTRDRVWSYLPAFQEARLELLSENGRDNLRHHDGNWLSDTIVSWNDQLEEWSSCEAHYGDPDRCRELECADLVVLHERRTHAEVLGLFEAAIKDAVREEEMA